MTTTAISTFEASLAELEVDFFKTDTNKFRGVLNPLLGDSAVGTPLPYDGVSLSDHVNTEPTPADLDAAETGVTAAGCAIADYGSVIIQSNEGGEEPVSLYPETHIAVIAASDVLPDMEAAFSYLADDFRAGNDQAIIATGPSATADMGALVKGVHGPQDVAVILLEDH